MVILDVHVSANVVYVAMARGAYGREDTLRIRGVKCEKHYVSCDIRGMDPVGPGFAYPYCLNVAKRRIHV